MIYDQLGRDELSEFEPVRSLLHATDPTFPLFLVDAERYGGVYRVRHASDEVGDGKVFRAPLESLHGDLVEAGLHLAAHYTSDGDSERLYSDRCGGAPPTTFVRVTEHGDEAVACMFVGWRTERYERWRAIVQKGALIEDLKKARWYLDRHIASLESQQGK